MKGIRTQQRRVSSRAAIGVVATAAVVISSQTACAIREPVPSPGDRARVQQDAPVPRPTTGGRSLAWVGCWEPVTEAVADTDASVPAERVCVMPGESIDEIRILTLEGDDVVLTTPVYADGGRRNVTRGGCSGWETGRWSADGRRILTHSELDCEGGLPRVSSGILAMLPGDEWLDIQVIESGREEATRVARYRPAPVPDAVASQLRPLMDERRLAIQTARTDAAFSLTLDDVTEAAQATNAKAVSALLVERGEGFDVDADELVALRQAGVPAEVTDLVVALSFPNRFTIEGGGASLRPQEPELGRGPGYAYGRGRRGGGYYGSCMGYGSYDPYGWYGFYPYSLFSSAYSWSSGFGCSPYGYFGGRYRGYRSGPIIIIQDNPRQRAPGGRMVRGEGYRGDASVGNDRGRRAVRRGSSGGAERSSSPPPRSTVGRSGSSSSGPPASSSGSSSGRRAKRRGGGS